VQANRSDPARKMIDIWEKVRGVTKLLRIAGLLDRG
jgi:hypothetical protein